jgi:hypothetical protein
MTTGTFTAVRMFPQDAPEVAPDPPDEHPASVTPAASAAAAPTAASRHRALDRVAARPSAVNSRRACVAARPSAVNSRT